MVAQLGKLFEARGYHLVAQCDATDGSGDKVYVFKGKHPPVVLGAIDSSGDGRHRFAARRNLRW